VVHPGAQTDNFAVKISLFQRKVEAVPSRTGGFMLPSLRHLIFCLSAALLLLLVCPAARAVGSKADVFLGYSRLGNNTFYANAGGLNGWEGALNVKMRRFVGIEGDVAQYGLGASASTPHTTVVLFGPRLTAGVLGVHLFAHALAGGEHSTNNSGLSQGTLAVGFGGGGDVPIAPFFAIRVSADYLNAPTQTVAGATRMRFSSGLVFRF
jgi:hypothetical protein